MVLLVVMMVDRVGSVDGWWLVVDNIHFDFPIYQYPISIA